MALAIVRLRRDLRPADHPELVAPDREGLEALEPLDEAHGRAEARL
jgi:hypothetical protein